MKGLFISGLCVAVMLFVEKPAMAQDGEHGGTEMTERGADFQRGMDRVRERGNREGSDIFDRLGNLFLGERTFDPLAGDEEAAEVQAINEGVGDRADAGADYVDAAADVVQAGMPAPSAGAEVGQQVIENVVEEAVAEEPGWFGQMVNSAIEWVGSWFESDPE